MRRHLEGIDLATTHALLRRATFLPLGILLLADGYNSRSPAESDVNKLLLPANDIATTHALLRRATATLCTLIDPQAGYNSRSPAESECLAEAGKRYAPCYNSRSPAESDTNM